MFKRVIAAMLMVISVSAFAEASFQQVESLIEQKQYAAAEMGLEGIIAAHPQSAKAYYAMAQAQAGLGHLEKAQYALNKARGIDPELKFASSSNIESLQQAITPQVAKIEVVTESHFWRNLFLIALMIGILYYVYTLITRKDDEDEYKPSASVPPAPTPPAGPTTTTSSNAAFAARSYVPPTAPAPQPTYSAQPAPTVINNHYGSNNSGSDMLTGVLVGEMIAGNHNHRDTVYVERDVYVAPAPVYTAPVAAPRSSWDDIDSTPQAPSRSSTWDDTPAPTRSSSWDDDSKSGSSWSSSSDDSSSSSWSDSSSSSGW